MKQLGAVQGRSLPFLSEQADPLLWNPDDSFSNRCNSHE